MGPHAPAGHNIELSLEGACSFLGPEGAHGAGHPAGRAWQCAKSWHFSVRIGPPGPSMQGAIDHGSGSSGRRLPDPGGVHRIGVGADSGHAVTVRPLRRWATSVGCSPCSLQSLLVADPVCCSPCSTSGSVSWSRTSTKAGHHPQAQRINAPNPAPPAHIVPASPRQACLAHDRHLPGAFWPGASVRRAFHPARAPCTWLPWMSCAST